MWDVTAGMHVVVKLDAILISVGTTRGQRNVRVVVVLVVVVVVAK